MTATEKNIKDSDENIAFQEGRGYPVRTKVVLRKVKSPNWFYQQAEKHHTKDKMDNPYEGNFGFSGEQDDDDFGNVNLEKINQLDSFGSGSYNQ